MKEKIKGEIYWWLSEWQLEKKWPTWLNKIVWRLREILV